MPKRLIQKIKGLIKGNSRTTIVRREIPRGEHHFPEEDIGRSVLSILDTLTKAGYEAYLVGGSIRDGLTGMHPKDFDVATSATPEQIRAQFRNCRLIGRRFRLAHVRVGRDVIEVATFRASHQNVSEDDEHASHQTDEGLLLRDNVFGTLDEDAVRRDFTANALYYRHTDGAIIDFVNGYDDIRHKRLRLIGDPEQRYREDPVRMLRAVRFAAKLGFQLEPATAAPIPQLADLLAVIPPARLFEEFLKLFLSGHAQAVWPLLNQNQLTRWLFPGAAPEVNITPGANGMIELALRNTDVRIAEDKPVTPYFLLAVLLWGPLQRLWQGYCADGIPPAPALQKAIQQVIHEQSRQVSIPKRFSMPMREIWELQGKLAQRSVRRCEQTFAHPRFRAAYDFLLLREEAGETPPGLGEWWTRYQQADHGEREKLCQNLGQKAPGKRRRNNSNRRRNRRPNNAG